MSIGLVVDSTADLPVDYYAEHDVTMVPLAVRFGEEVYRDWVDIPPEKLFERMKAGELAKTSQPTAGEFALAYKELAERGATEILSIHISSWLSGTIQSANIGAQQSPVPVRIVDTLNASMAIGLVLDRVVAARAHGAEMDELERVALATRDRIRDLFCVDSLKWLQMGGRIGKASALVGTLLNIKPVLTVTDGQVGPFKKAKGTARALEEIADAVQAESAGRPVRAALLYADERTAVDRLRGVLTDRGVQLDVLTDSSIGCVIGAYLGPGAFGIIYERNDVGG